MFKGWGTWLGLETAAKPAEDEPGDVVQEAEKTEAKESEVEKQEVTVQGDEEVPVQQLLQQAKGFSGESILLTRKFFFRLIT